MTMDLLRSNFPNLTPKQLEQFERLPSLYQKWHSRVPVFPRKELNLIEQEHILPALALTRIVTFHPASRVLDVGTGGGFPGIPLAIFYPEVLFVLLDGMQKRIDLVKIVAGTLGLKNVVAFHSRIEDYYEPFDFIISRAVAAFPKLVEMVRKNIDFSRSLNPSRGILYLKSGHFDDEIAEFKPAVRIFELSTLLALNQLEGRKIVYLPFPAASY